MRQVLLSLSGCVIALMLSACETHSEQPLYYWGAYPDTVYQGMQSKQSPEQQLAKLEEYLAKSRAHNSAVAPGVYAQLGMLYAQTGHLDQAKQAFNEEKTRFPESTRFMDFLLKKDGVKSENH